MEAVESNAGLIEMSSRETPQPPRLANRIFEWRCGHASVEDLHGDLEELFYADLERMSSKRAKWNYWLRVLSLVFSYAFRRRKQRGLPVTRGISLKMIPGYVTIAQRNLIKNKLYAVINILGLSLAVSCCTIIFIIIRYETSFDNYHSKADRIYRVNLKYNTPGGIDLTGRNFTPLAQAIRSEVTGLEAVTGVYCWQQYELSVNDHLYKAQYAFFVEPEYFNVFDVAWIAGNQQQALTRPGSVVVTDVFADQYLGGTTSALGSTFLLEGKQLVTVTGVVKAPPSNTDHRYTLLISFPTLATFMPNSMGNWKTVDNGATYVVFRPETNADNVYAQFKALRSKYLPQEELATTDFFLMPLADNHDNNNNYDNFTYDFPVPVMIILSIISGMIACIACINFINLATAQSLNRVREIGIRKTMGGSRGQLIIQHMSESVVITIIAALVGLVLAKIGMELLSIEYGGWDLRFDFLRDPSIILFLAGITLAIAILAGFYPAFVVSGYKPVWALNTQTGAGKSRGFSIRKLLVVSQFTFAQMLVLIALIMTREIELFKERPTGYDPETIVTLPSLRGYEPQQTARLCQELQKIPGVKHVAFTRRHILGGDAMEFHPAGQKDALRKGLINYSDEGYIKTFEVELLAGKNLADWPSASWEVLVNESLIKALGFEYPGAAIGAIFTANDQDFVIRGVMRDYYNRPMSNTVDPLILQYDPSKIVGVAMSISTDDLPATLAGIDDAWTKTYPDYLCPREFLDVMLARRFGFFNRIFSFLSIGASLAIFIGCLGLYGFISFMAQQRTREIGIRKVLGATVSNIVVMFSKESSLLIIMAFVIAAPLGYFLGQLMLIELPEHHEPSAGLFITTIASALVIALLTIGHRAVIAALQNPSDILRTN